MRNRQKLILVMILSVLIPIVVHAQKLKIGDFEKALGSWKGTLTYLDYTSNKPVTIPSNVLVKINKSKNTLVLIHSFPTEPNANSTDSLVIENDKINNEKIITHQFINGSRLIVSEITSVDGNKNKEAVIRHNYKIGDNGLQIWKEVKFVGTEVWIKRNEFNYKPE